jgi:hypothetical protein
MVKTSKRNPNPSPETAVLNTEITDSVAVARLTPAQVGREFRKLLDQGIPIQCVGDAKDNPRQLLRSGFTPRAKIELFDTVFYLSNPRQNPDLRFFVAYVLQPNPEAPASGKGGRRRKPQIYPRIFYKDVSLIWRAASHWVELPDETWIGKGDVRVITDVEGELMFSAESTTDLPLEMQTALEDVHRTAGRPRFNESVVPMVLQRARTDRIEAFRDFTAPRRRAASEPENLIHGGKEVVYFERPNVPESLRFVAGFEPDLDHGLIEESTTRSSMYGGTLRRFRFLSKNRQIQYMFFLGPHHAWIIPPQALTTELSTFGVRTVDVEVDEDAFVPGFEYHYIDDSVEPPELHSQIPEGFAGAASEHDESRSDASPWLDRLPIIQEFRARYRAILS